MKKEEVAQKAVDVAHAIILVYSTMVAINGVATYTKSVGKWAGEKTEKKTKHNRHKRRT